MNKLLFTFLVITIPYLGSGQSLSIEQLWQQASQSRAHQKQNFQIGVQREELRAYQLDRLPVIYGDLNQQYNIIRPTTPVPAIAFDPSASEGAILPLRFSTRWMTKAAIQLEWKIFDPEQRNEAHKSKLELEKSKVQAQQTEQQWIHDATLAYASTVLASQQYQAALEDSTAYAHILKITQARFEAGRATSMQYNTAQQEMENKKIQIYEAYTVWKESHLELQRYIDLSNITTLSSGIAIILDHVKDKENTDYNTQLASLDSKIANLEVKQVKSSLLPKINLNASYGRQFFSNDFQLFESAHWYGNSFASIGMKIPLSAYFTVSNPLRKASLYANIAALNLSEEQENERISAEKKQSKVSAAAQKLNSYEKIKALASEQKEIAWKAYQQGRILLSEYNTACSDYIKAQQHVWQAQYDAIAACLE